MLISRRSVLLPILVGLALACVLCGAPTAGAATCPSPNPVVQENACAGAGSTGWRLTSYDPNSVAGFATKPSVNVGSPVTLDIGGFDSSDSRVDISVYRIGYYGGTGGRLVHSATNVTVNNGYGCGAPDSVTGLVSCDNWDPTYTIPASALATSGVYVAKLRSSGGGESQVLFVVRDDNRHAAILYKLPTATYHAYNNWGDKSLYDFNSMGSTTVAGTARAAKVSFLRPIADERVGDNWFMKSDYAMIYWLERQGYDVSYTEDVSVSQDPGQLLNHRIDMVGGHDEYWTAEEMHGYKAARDAGVSVSSFSGNTAYWKTRLEDGGTTLVCYKTVQGSGTNGAAGANDWGPDGVKGTADDALGADGVAGTADDRPQNSTTTWRDNGAPPGSAGAPPAGRVGPDEPENSLFGNMYVGDNDSVSYPLTVPAADAENRYAGDRIWRNTGISKTSSTAIGSKLIGWEWDAVPTNPQYLAKQPAGVIPISASNTTQNGSEWLQDEGRVYGAAPPPGQPGITSAVKYRASSGALVFSAGTNQWSWGLGPHWIDQPGTGQTYQDPPTDSTDPRISQATYNIFSDMGVQPDTPVGITLDSGNQPPTASFTASPNPVLSDQTVTFDASASSDTDGDVVQYAWDLDGNGSYETVGDTPVVTHSYPTPGTVTVGLRVTDDGDATATTTRTLTVTDGNLGPYAEGVLGTSGVADYWRLGEPAGATALLNQLGAPNLTTSGGVTLGVPGALSGDDDTAARFDGVDDAAEAAVDLSDTSKLTVEFWLKWNAYANDDKLAMELTPNFNQNAGGFLIDPNAPQNGGTFGVALGLNGSRNSVFFARPSAGTWHHYAFVFDTTAPAATQIIPYVDGVAVPYTKLDSGTGAGNFANAVLNVMSRDGSSLFGAGDMDELALYKTTLPATTIRGHYETGSGGGVNAAPTASFTAAPNPATTGQQVTFDASASTDGDGTIAKVEWDLDGNGTYETDTGTSRTTTHTYATAGTVTVGLRVTDNDGATDTTTRSVTVQSSPPPSSPYAQAVQSTAGAAHYWRLGEASGTNLADRIGTANLTSQGGVTLGVPGAIGGDPDTAARFDGSDDAARGTVNLSSTSKLTAEFWLKWNAYANDDKLAMELTPNFNQNDGGFIVDPNDASGKFAVGLGRPGNTRNNVLFNRPSAGAWHHYAFVMDTTAAGATQIIPYVDGAPVAYTKLKSGTGAGPFANGPLNVMSRNGSGLFGAGDLDEVALYTTTLPAATIAAHYQAGTGTSANAAPTAAFTATPNPATTGQQVTFDASASADGDGTIAKVEWDLDGNGTYETDTGTGRTTTHTYATAGTVTVGLRVTDDDGATDTVEHDVTIQAPANQAPTASFTAAPNPATTGEQVTFDASASADGDGTIAKHEWDLDGNGSYETDTGATATTSSTYTAAGTVTVGLRVTDNNGATATTTRSVTIQAPPPASSAYAQDVLGTTGVKHYWRLGEASGTNLVDQLGSVNLTSQGGVTLGVAGALTGDPDTAARFDGVNDAARATVNLSSTSKLTVEFWLKWNAYANDDRLAMELTPNFNTNGGGFIVDPNDASGKFAVGLGRANSTRNNVLFDRPSAGAWHHYAFVLDTTAPAATQITPYVDGVAVPYTKLNAGTGAGTFANAALNVMSRNAASLFGTGDLDEVALYTTTLPAATIADHYSTGSGQQALTTLSADVDTANATRDATGQASGPALDEPPTAAFTATPNPVVAGDDVAFDASGSTDSDGKIVKYEWDLDGDGTFETDGGGDPTTTNAYKAAGDVAVGLRVTDDHGATATTSVTLKVSEPPAPDEPAGS